MILEKEKSACNCGWKGMDSELLKAKNPFEPEDTVYACPECKELEGSYFSSCDEPACWRETTCGTPTANGYRRTCSEHMPKEQ